MANIGSLTADLRLESAAFIRDLGRASNAVAQNTSKMNRSISAMQAGIARAGAAFKGAIAGFVSVAAVRGLANVAKAAVNLGDDIATAATKIGINAQELQRLRFAAEQTDVSIGDLDNALKLFQKNIASGKIEPQGFQEFIQRIREAPSQIEKVAIAQEALGKQFQSAILLAAQSGEEFRKQYDSAYTISQRALDAASNLDNQMRSLSDAIVKGFTTGLLESFVGDLETSKDTLDGVNAAAKTLGETLGDVLRGGIDLINFTIKRWQAWKKLIEDIDALLPRIEIPSWMGGGAGDGLNLDSDAKDFFADALKPAKQALDEFNGSVGDSRDKIGEWRTTVDSAIESQLRLAESMVAATAGPFQVLRQELDALQLAYDQNIISAEQMANATRMAAASAVQPWLQVADTVGGALGTLFKDNKAVAIAQAVINTAQGITAALAQYPPPLSFAMAAAQAAAGAAQIAAIKSTNPGTSKTPKVSGGGSRSAASSTASTQETPLQDRAVFINLQGSGRYSRAEIEGLISELIEAQKDGARLVLSRP